MDIICNHKKAQQIIDNAYNEVALNPENSFNAMVLQVDEVLSERYEFVTKRNAKLKNETNPQVAKTHLPYSKPIINKVFFFEKNFFLFSSGCCQLR